MSSEKKKNNSYSQFWRTHDKRARDRARKVYPAMYRLYHTVFTLTILVWGSYFILPPWFEMQFSNYSTWGPTYEMWTLIVSAIMLPVYIVVNMLWQKKVGKFASKVD